MMSQDTFDNLVENLSKTSSSLTRRLQRAKTQEEIAALIAAIETYGVSPSLLAFANYNGILGRVVPSIPSVETLTPDLADLDSAKIVAELKAIQFESAEEGFNFGALKEIITAITIIKTAISAYTAYKDWKEDRENHVTTVVPYATLSQQLHASDAIGPVADHANASLPKNKDEYADFIKQVVQASSALSTLGIHVALVNNAPHIAVDELPETQKVNIESVGYRATTITDLANLVTQASDHATQHVNFMTAGPDENKMSHDEEEKQWQMKAWCAVADIVDTAARRLLRLVKLTESTIKNISPFYKAG